MSIPSFLFYCFEVLAALAALGLVFVRQVFYGALLLVICLLCLAGIYVLAFAEFVAVTQILIYAGGILVVIIFGIMLTAKMSGKPMQVTNRHWIGGTIVGTAIAAALLVLFSHHPFAAAVDNNRSVSNTIPETGVSLMTDFVLPFEISGLLLLVSLVGAAVIAASPKIKKG